MNNLVGTYEYIPAEYIVAGVKMRLGIKDTTEDDAFIEDLVNTGAKRIKNRGTQPEITTILPIVNHQAKLPQGFIKFAHDYPIRYVNADGTSNRTNWWYVPQYINNAFFNNSVDNNFRCWAGSIVRIENGYLQFSTHPVFKHVEIVYDGANLDNGGQIAIHAVSEDAIMAFCCWQYGLTFGKYDQYRMEVWRKQWKNGKRELKALFNGDQGYDRPLIIYQMNKLV